MSIQSGYEHDDNQTATIKGKLELVRGAGGSCASSFLVTNATIQFQNVSQTFTSLEEQFNLLERPLVLDGPTVFSSNSSQQDDDDENVNKICVPKGEDVWKTNLRRSLVFMLTANLKAYNDLGEMESFPVILDGSDYVGVSIFELHFKYIFKTNFKHIITIPTFRMTFLGLQIRTESQITYVGILLHPKQIALPNYAWQVIVIKKDSLPIYKSYLKK